MPFPTTLPHTAALLLGTLLASLAQPAAAQRNPVKAVSGPTRKLLQQERYAEAQVEIDQRLRQDSLNTDLLGLRAECLLAQPSDAHTAAALHDLNQALRLRPNTWLYLFERGYAYQRLHRYPEALADLSAALHQTPAEPMLLSQRGFLHLTNNHLPEALTDLAQSTALAPAVPEYSVLLLIGHMVTGNYLKAFQLCNAVIARNKSFGLGYANRALLRVQQHDQPGARQDADQALRLSPQDSTAQLISAFVYQAAGNETAAKKEYDALQAREHDKSVLYAERGDLYLQLGNIPAAEADWKRAAQLGNGEAAARLAAGFRARQ
jgi:tetratricopeptide (TPR) repeat protein